MTYLLDSFLSKPTLLTRRYRCMRACTCRVSGSQRNGFLKQMMRTLLLWVYPADVVLQQARQSDEGQLLDACR